MTDHEARRLGTFGLWASRRAARLEYGYRHRQGDMIALAAILRRHTDGLPVTDQRILTFIDDLYAPDTSLLDDREKRRPDMIGDRETAAVMALGAAATLMRGRWDQPTCDRETSWATAMGRADPDDNGARRLAAILNASNPQSLADGIRRSAIRLNRTAQTVDIGLLAADLARLMGPYSDATAVRWARDWARAARTRR